MKTTKKMVVLMAIVLVCINLGGCGGTKNKEAQKTQEPAANTATPEETAVAEAFEYELTTKNRNTEGITVKYPMVVNSNNEKKADLINELIMNDMDSVIEGIKAGADNSEGLTIDALYDYTNDFGPVISISYLGTYFQEAAAYPVNFYHTITISTDDVAVIPLSDLFVIDDAFVESFKQGTYAPLTDDLDLEASDVNVSDLISEQYTNEQLIEWFSKEDANYYLTSQGIILSVEVPHAVGDHLEMAITYENLESNIKKEHPLWANYMYLSEDNGTDSSETDVTWAKYRFKRL